MCVPLISTLFPYTTLFRSRVVRVDAAQDRRDLGARVVVGVHRVVDEAGVHTVNANDYTRAEDRKSTRLNSSHQIISYAVFCLKKKKKTTPPTSYPKSRVRY